MSMAGRDGTDPGSVIPDSLLADSAMHTGSDAGQPGGHLGPGDLDPDEERLLAALERDTGPLSRADAATVQAAEDERPLPGEGGAPDDGLTPRFVAPGSVQGDVEAVGAPRAGTTARGPAAAVRDGARLAASRREGLPPDAVQRRRPAAGR
jgi:hypothetical protein